MIHWPDWRRRRDAPSREHVDPRERIEVECSEDTVELDELPQEPKRRLRGLPRRILVRFVNPPKQPDAAAAEASIEKVKSDAAAAAAERVKRGKTKKRHRKRGRAVEAQPTAEPAKPTKREGKQQERKRAEAAERFRRVHGREPVTLVRVGDGWVDETAQPPDPDVTYWHGADGGHEEWR